MKITMMILFINIALTLAIPTAIFGSNPFYQAVNGQYQVSGNVPNAVNDINPSTGSLVINGFGLIDTIKLIASFLLLIIQFVTAALQIIFILPNPFNLLIGIPLWIMYAYAVVGWIKG